MLFLTTLNTIRSRNTLFPGVWSLVSSSVSAGFQRHFFSASVTAAFRINLFFVPALRSPTADPRDAHDANADREGLQPRFAQTLPTGADTASRGSVLEPQAAAGPPHNTPPPDGSGPAPDSAASPMSLVCDDRSGPTAASVGVEAIPRQDGPVERQDRSKNRSPEPESALPVPGSSGSAVSVPLSTGVVKLAEAEEMSPLAEGGGGVRGGKVSAGGRAASAVPCRSEDVPGGRVFEAGSGVGSPSLRGGAAFLPEDAPRAALGAAALQGCGSLLGSNTPVEATTTGGVPEERPPGTEAEAPAPHVFSTEAAVDAPFSQGLFIANAVESLAGSPDTYTPEAGAAMTLQQGRDSQLIIRVEGERYGAASGAGRQAVSSSAAAAATTPSNTGSFQGSCDAASGLSKSSDMFSRRGSSLDRVAEHDERPRPAYRTTGQHSGLDVGRNPARSEGTKDASLRSGNGGMEVPDLPLQGAAPLKAGTMESSVGGQALRPPPGGVEGWTREREGQVVMVERGEWEALRRENDGLRKQAALLDKR